MSDLPGADGCGIWSGTEKQWREHKSKKFWDGVKKTADEVAKWPAWKRGEKENPRGE